MHSLLVTPPQRSRQRTSRLLAAWACALLGPLALAAIFHFYEGPDAQPIGLMMFMAIPVAASILGGLWPSLTAAALAAGAANYTLFTPVGTFTVHGRVAIYTLIIFVIVALAVSIVVSIASRRSATAKRARYEADALIALAEDTMRSGDGVRSLLEHTREVFGQQQVWLAEQSGRAWVELAATRPLDGQPDDPASRRTEVAHVRGYANAEGRRAVFALGTALPAELGSLFEVFARQISEVWDLVEMRANAAEAEYRASQDELRLSLLAALSHDLRTPLSGAKTAVQTLRSQDAHLDPADRSYLLETVEGSIDELTRILRNLLDQTRIRSGSVQPVLQPVSLDEVIPVSISMVNQTHPNGPLVRFEAPEDLPLVSTDPGMLERIIANLVENAVRHGSPPGSLAPLVAVVEPCPHQLEIQVIDHGPGLDPASRASMFQAFQRHGDVPQGNGLGLGLAVAQGLAKALGTQVDVRDTEGGGLTMVVRLGMSRNAAGLVARPAEPVDAA
ncbi:DUF4118 domain-containing protein [Micrococcales bacterium 31B]|nr:DUF4118 domain-containing protein [Micrococcales bacterium 31B]